MKRQNALWAFALVFFAFEHTASENVTLSTYYPAPSGVYTQIITTGRSILARDGQNVGIGTSSPATKLEVNGDLSLSLVGGAAIYRVQNVGLPLLDSDAANKEYVDAATVGSDAHITPDAAICRGDPTCPAILPLTCPSGWTGLSSWPVWIASGFPGCRYRCVYQTLCRR
ncbi:MAG: hypothetical protein HY549_04395 [Elusimicrobia bacterium]|nr:hypothetical protein [Elusimicrobiota bacterium]